MIVQLSADEMNRAIENKRYGLFFARMGVNDYMGYANLDGSQIMYRGHMADVLDMFVPFNGINHVIHDSMWGISVTADGAVPIPEEAMREPKPYKRRKERDTDGSIHGNRTGV